AIGASRILGIELTRNFDRPYGSVSIAEFWRRWHISLSTWFRDYVFIPLGGSRVGWARRAFNLAVVFLLSGLWPGANWTFVLWGAYHGALMIVTVAVTAAWKRFVGEIRIARPLGAVVRAAGVVLTFHLVCLGWVLFRARDLAHARLLFSRFAVSDVVSVGYELTRIGPAPPVALGVDLAILLISVVVLEVASEALRRRERPRTPA